MELGRFQGSSWMLIWIKLRPRTVQSSFCLNSGAGEWHEDRKGTEVAWGTVAQRPTSHHQTLEGSESETRDAGRTPGYYLAHREQIRGTASVLLIHSSIPTAGITHQPQHPFLLV